MKKIAKYLLIALCGASVWSCDLATTSPSVVDGEFVFGGIETGRTAILAAYNQLINDYNNGYVPNFTNIGSDVERCSVGNITDLVGGAQLYLEPYDEARFNINFQKGNWNRFYSIIFKCNSIIENIESNSDIENIIATAPNDLSDLLGQAYCLRASVYYDMTMYYGDVIYIKAAREESTELRSRFAILEDELEHLIEVEPLMYQIGSNGHLSDQMTRNFCEGLIGRICFALAGYQTRRTDLGADFYVDNDGQVLSFEDWGTDSEKGAAYGRRSDWKNFYSIALPYLKRAVEDPGEAILTTVDPRSESNRTYGNPFQYYFQQVNEEYKAPETIYEVTMKEVGGGSRIAYNFGRGSNGASPGLPPKANAQICTFPEVYYGEFDPQDMRRDVSMSVTGSSGAGVEVLYNFNLTNRLTLGVGLNKYDPNRVATPDLRQLNSGVSYIHMRQADIILMLAEAYAQTGDEANAKIQLKKVHDRAFPDAIQDAKFNELLASQPTLVDAILKERQLEFQGENLRRWDLVRSGKLPEVAYEFRKKLVDHMAEMKSAGYATFENGNEFPAYVWTKLVDAKKVYGYRLTMQTPEGKEDDPVLYPGWRGQHDDWQKAKDYQEQSRGNTVKAVPCEDYTNLAIKGLFKHIEPGSAEAAALEADGYKQTDWGVLMYTKGGKEDANQEAEWSTKFLGGYTDADYAAKKAPIYLIPMETTVCVTTGLKNGYGFQNPS
ncbi:MAG: RagB/SusD family nutrient uptake outer membrane protein [Bacteroidales bacterium]|nr:RagB/SusD family nutrient uptake outer membrane protein [Bacteroidales bacterium]